jgi:DNA-binding response OmpR family regulator
MSVTSILLVEDDDDVRALFEEALQTAGFSVRSIALASKIFDLAPRRDELILLDLGMPQGTLQGMEALTLLRRIDAWREIPVIILSAFGDVVNRTITSRLGVVDILSKPVGIAELIAFLQHATRRAVSRN